MSHSPLTHSLEHLKPLHQLCREGRLCDVERFLGWWAIEEAAHAGHLGILKQVWSEPALSVAKGYGFSSVWLGKVCRLLNVPVPPRGYWARVRSGGKGRKPPLPVLRMKPESTVT
jgi:hypothetical protein